jgi:hypothetical protein
MIIKSEYESLAANCASRIEKIDEKIYYSFTPDTIKLFAEELLKIYRFDPRMDPAQR